MNFLKRLAEAVTRGRRVSDDPGAPATGGADTGTAPPSSFPSKDNFLKRIIAAGVPVSEIVDVGVREGTYELAARFPDRRHHLFEPAGHWVGDIASNYRDIRHVLYRKALGSSNELHYLVSCSLQNDGVPTHSAIVRERPQVDGRGIVAAEAFRIERFDSLNIDVAQDFLLKVDVDGLDTEVLKGFGETIRRASVVIVEATGGSVAERAAFLQAAGFVLVDIVDLTYYGLSLHQLDLCFVRADLVTEKLRPDIARFDSALWRQIA
jgi:FkbM family methyltransferase